MSELAKRIRAARNYAGLSQKQLSELLEVDEQTVKRTEAGKRTPKRPELLAIAHECQLPMGFFTADLARLESLSPSLDERLAQLEDGIDAVVSALVSGRDADRDATLARWRAHRQQRSEGRGRGSSTLGEE